MVSAEADEDFAQGELEGAAVGGRGELEAAASSTGVGVCDGKTVGVVVIAEGLAADGGGAAAVAVGEDVVAFGDECVHGWGPPPVYFWA